MDILQLHHLFCCFLVSIKVRWTVSSSLCFCHDILLHQRPTDNIPKWPVIEATESMHSNKCLLFESHFFLVFITTLEFQLTQHCIWRRCFIIYNWWLRAYYLEKTKEKLDWEIILIDQCCSSYSSIITGLTLKLFLCDNNIPRRKTEKNTRSREKLSYEVPKEVAENLLRSWNRSAVWNMGRCFFWWDESKVINTVKRSQIMAAKTSFLVISVFTLKLKRFPVENSIKEGDE